MGANRQVKWRFSKVHRQLLLPLDRVTLLPQEGQAGSLPASSFWLSVAKLVVIPPPPPSAFAGIVEQIKGCFPDSYPFFPIGLRLPGTGPSSGAPPSVRLNPCTLAAFSGPAPLSGLRKAVGTLSCLSLERGKAQGK